MMPNFLTKLKLKEISLVDKGINPGAKVVFAKRAEDASNPQVGPLSFDQCMAMDFPNIDDKEAFCAALERGEINKFVEENKVRKLGKSWKERIAKILGKSQEKPMAEPVAKQLTLEEVLALLNDEQKAVILEALEAAAKKEVEPEKQAEDEKTEEEKTDEEKAFHQEEEMKKALAKLPQSVRDKIAKADDLEKRVKKMEDDDALRVAVAKAKKLQYVSGMKTEELGKFLKSASESMGPEAFKTFEALLKGANDAVKKSGLLSELGSGLGGDGNASSELEAIAKSLKEKDPKLTIQKARLEAAKLNPELYNQHTEETREGAH